MNSYEAMQIITSSLTRKGATCVQEGKSIIVATWKATVWRIFINYLGTDSKRLASIIKLDAAIKNNQQTVIARICPDGRIEYRNIENGKKIYPICLNKSTRTLIFKRELHEES